MKRIPQTSRQTQCIKPGNFEAEKHYYTKVLNAQIHPLVSYFFNLSKERIINRYCHLHPQVSKKHLIKCIMYRPKHFFWAGADLFYVATKSGNRKMVVIETNSSPSGQKSMPLLIDHKEVGGYQQLIEHAFLPKLKEKKLPKGALAVLYDKNYMEASGYAAALAETVKEPVFLVPFFNGDADPPARFTKGILSIRDKKNKWHPIKAALRYVTQKPWNRIPVTTKTFIYNPIIACLAGGRNKMMAAKAYDLLNAELMDTGLGINMPETIYGVAKREIPLWIKQFKGHAVIKIPYSNAGQGVFTITNKNELQAFMKMESSYKKYVVQGLIGNYAWSSDGREKFYHIGTVPNKKKELFVADLRMMLCPMKEGFRPVAIYARRASKPLKNKLTKNTDSWSMLGTNLSVKEGENQWTSDTNRLLIMDRKDFNTLGIGIDDLVEAYVQTLLAIIAIDKMAATLINEKGKFNMNLFKSLNKDAALINEIYEEKGE
jgi:hypothetical protein